MSLRWPRAREGRSALVGGPQFVAGLDTASDRFHLIYDDDQGEDRFFVRVTGDPDDRRRMLHENALAAFGSLPAGCHVFCEEPLALKNGKTTRVLGLAAGAIWAAHLEFDLFWHWVDVSSWKKAICGNGNLKKDLVVAVLQDRHGLSFDEPDFYDAWALREYGRGALPR